MGYEMHYVVDDSRSSLCTVLRRLDRTAAMQKCLSTQVSVLSAIRTDNTFGPR